MDAEPGTLEAVGGGGGPGIADQGQALDRRGLHPALGAWTAMRRARLSMSYMAFASLWWSSVYALSWPTASRRSPAIVANDCLHSSRANTHKAVPRRPEWSLNGAQNVPCSPVSTGQARQTRFAPR